MYTSGCVLLDSKKTKKKKKQNVFVLFSRAKEERRGGQDVRKRVYTRRVSEAEREEEMEISSVEPKKKLPMSSGVPRVSDRTNERQTKGEVETWSRLVVFHRSHPAAAVPSTEKKREENV